jgi:crotonobetainyl-CoA:carnitine CoA-transferase CaiB-like acyl-CoA transferase
MTRTPAVLGAVDPPLRTATTDFTGFRTRTGAPRAPAQQATDRGAARGPLTGVTIVELAWFYAAPFGLALLADLGARVIKVEGPEGDPHRYQSGVPEHAGVKGLQGKESVVIDYRQPEGEEILHRLVARADLVMSNYRQANHQRSRDSYDRLAAHNADLVYLYAGAYGSGGPYSARPAFAPTMSVAAGQRAYQLGWPRALERIEEISFAAGSARWAHINRWDGGLTLNGDASAAVAVGTAALLGLVARQRNGVGQYMETTMLCSNAYVVSEEFFDYPGKVAAAAHDVDGVHALYRLYPTGAGWIFLAAPLPSEWDDLCRALQESTGDSSLLFDDHRFASTASRRAHDQELAGVLTKVFATRGAAEWESILTRHDVAGVEVSRRSLSEFTISSPTVIENGFVAGVEHPRFGPHRRHGPMVTLSRTPGTVGAGSLVGQHTRKVLAELGYREADMASLRAKGIIDWPDGPDERGGEPAPSAKRA